LPAAAKPSRSADPPAPSRPASRSVSAIVVFLAITAAGVAADLWSKHAAFQSFLDDEGLAAEARMFHDDFRGRRPTAREFLATMRRRVCPGVWLSLSTNPGVVFGLPMPRWAVAAITAGAVGLVGLFFAQTDHRARWLHVGLALILGGALGNLYDRLFSVVRLPGFEPIRYEVRDFIDCSELHWHWVFNVADVLLVVGVAILMVHRLVAPLVRRSARRAAAAGAPRSGAAPGRER
jgi:signal peptidase II